MTSQFSSLLSEEKGGVLILVSFVIVILLAMAGLAIDAGNIFHARIQLQKAVDTGALAGIGSTFLNENVPIDQSDLRDYIHDKAKDIVESNLLYRGFDLSQVATTYNYEPLTHTLTVTSETNTFSLLMKAVPFQLLGIDQVPEFFEINVVAEIQRAPANLAIVLDLSDSMDCPSEGDCDCKTPDRVSGATCEEVALTNPGNQNTKIQDLKLAVDDFVGLFDPSYDRIGVVGYKMVAEELVQLNSDGSRGFDPTAFDAIDLQVPSGSTNTCDGMMTAYSAYRRLNIINNEEIAYVLFSDGAPTAGRFLFSSPEGTMETSNEQGLGDHDYLSWAVEWQDSITGTRWTGPSMLTKKRVEVTPTNGVDAPVGASGDFVPSCQFAISPSQPLSDSSQYNKLFDDCLVNMGFHMPDAAHKVYGQNISGTGANRYDTEWRKQYYHCVVATTDHLRSNKGSVYSIGLGEARDLAADLVAADPYQDIDDTLFRRDFLLARASNDYYSARPLDSNENELTAQFHPEFDFEGYTDYEEILSSNQNNPSFGRYYPTPDPAELKNTFRSIGQKVLLKLVK